MVSPRIAFRMASRSRSRIRKNSGPAVAEFARIPERRNRNGGTGTLGEFRYVIGSRYAASGAWEFEMRGRLISKINEYNKKPTESFPWACRASVIALPIYAPA